MSPRGAIAVVIFAIAVTVNVIVGCGSPKRSSCGNFHHREDGNWCQECEDVRGNYARCRSSEPLP